MQETIWQQECLSRIDQMSLEWVTRYDHFLVDALNPVLITPLTDIVSHYRNCFFQFSAKQATQKVLDDIAKDVGAIGDSDLFDLAQETIHFSAKYHRCLSAGIILSPQDLDEIQVKAEYIWDVKEVWKTAIQHNKISFATDILDEMGAEYISDHLGEILRCRFTTELRCSSNEKKWRK